MHILITGANGYIGQRLIPVLLEQGHTLHCCVRNRQRFEVEHTHPSIHIIEVDFLEEPKPNVFPAEIEVAYYLIHSMSSQGDFAEKEARTAHNFLEHLRPTQCQQVIYLSGIVNESELSKHLESRLQVEQILNNGQVPVTTLRAGIIVGSGSASFEIIRDIVEKLPVMIAPRWLDTRCQPIAIRNVIEFLTGVILREEYYHKSFDIGGGEILTYKEMLHRFAAVRGFRRFIFTLPVMTPRLSSYWLYFITSISYPLAVNLVNSMKVDVICRPNSLAADLGIQLLSYEKAVDLAFQKIAQNMVISSWKDAFISADTTPELMDYVEVPKHGVFTDTKFRVLNEPEAVTQRIWGIGGQNGWYYANLLWKFRGYLDKLAGGVGLRRGRTNLDKINPGDALDFWRVLVADRPNRRLLLFAEMKLPGEAWLEFKISKEEGQWKLRQTATFRPKGVWGRLYWNAVLPFHFFVFNGMIDAISQEK